jgi:hypothetical protein
MIDESIIVDFPLFEKIDDIKKLRLKIDSPKRKVKILIR